MPREVRVHRMNISRRGGFVGLEAQVGVVFAKSDSRQLRGHGDWTSRFRGKHGPIEALGYYLLSLSLPLHPAFSPPDLSSRLEYYSAHRNEHV